MSRRSFPLLWKWRTASFTFYEVDEECVDSPFESSSSSDSNHDEVVIRDLEEEQGKGDPIVKAAGSPQAERSGQSEPHQFEPQLRLLLAQHVELDDQRTWREISGTFRYFIQI